jgi:hypothetical protein
MREIVSPISGIRSPFGQERFSPYRLFATGEQGVWYDPGDFSTMFQDRAGTTPVTAVEQPVGLMLDKSKGLTLGPELVSNPGPFTTTTGWTLYDVPPVTVAGSLTVASDNLTLFGSQTIGSRAIASITTVSGRWYKATINVVSATFMFFRITTDANGGSITGFPTTVITSGGAYTAYFLATAATTYVVFTSNADTSSVVSGFSVKELPGNHAFQATSASRPILARQPLSGVRNLATYSEDYSGPNGAPWLRVATNITANTTVAPNGETTASTLAATAATTQHNLTRTNISVVSGQTYVISLYAKKKDTNFLQIAGAFSGFGSDVWANFDLDAGTVGSVGASATADIEDVGSGWFRCYVVGTASSTVNNSGPLYAVVLSSSATRNPSFDGTGAGIYVWGAQFEASATLTPYQKVVSEYDVTEAGVQSVFALDFDGTDDSLETASIDFSSSDEMSVFAGIFKASDAAQGLLVELSNTFTNPGSFNAQAPGQPGTQYRFVSNNTGAANASTGFAAPSTVVYTGLADISADNATLRLNGAQIAVGIADQGTGNYGDYPLYIGRRGGSTLPLNGRLFSLIIRGKSSTASQITQSEAWVNARTGAY